MGMYALRNVWRGHLFGAVYHLPTQLVQPRAAVEEEQESKSLVALLERTVADRVSFTSQNSIHAAYLASEHIG